MSTSTLTRARTRLFPSSLLVAAGLVVGFAVAQGHRDPRARRRDPDRHRSRRRPGSGCVAAAGRSPSLLGLLYLAAFVLSHVLTLGLGMPAWAVGEPGHVARRRSDLRGGRPGAADRSRRLSA